VLNEYLKLKFDKNWNESHHKLIANDFYDLYLYNGNLSVNYFFNLFKLAYARRAMDEII
jgi:hypothetical protein